MRWRFQNIWHSILEVVRSHSEMAMLNCIWEAIICLRSQERPKRYHHYYGNKEGILRSSLAAVSTGRCCPGTWIPDIDGEDSILKRYVPNGSMELSETRYLPCLNGQQSQSSNRMPQSRDKSQVGGRRGRWEHQLLFQNQPQYQGMWFVLLILLKLFGILHCSLFGELDLYRPSQGRNECIIGSYREGVEGLGSSRNEFFQIQPVHLSWYNQCYLTSRP